MENRICAVVLAAGKGKRLRTEGCDLPKVMREALGRPLLSYVLDAISFIGRENINIVVGYRKEKVTEAFGGYTFSVQEQQLGTGHAVMCARPFLEERGGSVLLCYGDMPLLSEETYRDLIRTHFEKKNDCTLLTGTSDEDLPYGRIVRGEDGGFLEVVEDKDCTPEQKKIRELNVGVYVFNTALLLDSLSGLKNSNTQGEYYITDVPYLLRRKGAKIGLCTRNLGSEIIGINTPEQLRQVENLLSLKKGAEK